MPGASSLNAFGLAYARTVWLSRATEWRVGDLALIVSLALTSQNLEKVAADAISAAPILVNGSGGPIVNPIFKLQEQLRQRQQQLMRDLGLRTKDREAPDAEPPAPELRDLPPGASADWMKRLKAAEQ